MSFNAILQDIVELFADRYPNLFAADLVGLEGVIAATPDIPYLLIADRLYEKRRLIRGIYNKENQTYNWGVIYTLQLDEHLKEGEKSSTVVRVFNDSMKSFRQLDDADKIIVWKRVMALLAYIKEKKTSVN